MGFLRAVGKGQGGARLSQYCKRNTTSMGSETSSFTELTATAETVTSLQFPRRALSVPWHIFAEAITS